MNDGLMERLARALSTALGDDYNLAFESKQDWITARGGKPFRDVNMPYKGDYTEAVKAILSELSAAGVLNEWKPIESAPCDGTQFIAWGRFDCGTLWLNTDVYRWRDNWISVGDGIVCPQEWCSLPEAMLKARPV